MLGVGGSAVVYAASLDGVPVALKVPRLGDTLTPREQARFLREARMLARVRHEGVIEVVDSGRLSDGRPYVATRRYDGETLAALLARRGKLPVDHALRLFEQLAEAAGALHDEGLVHRDIKPENVLVTHDAQRVKLLDLGIAKDLNTEDSTTTRAGISRGTPATMAPERFLGAAASVRTDVYELAVVLYAMLVGRLPWPNATDAEARLMPSLPAELGVELPTALSDEIMRSLSTRAERRPVNAHELGKCILEAARAVESDAPRHTLKLAIRGPSDASTAGKKDGQNNDVAREPAPWTGSGRVGIGVAMTLVVAAAGALPALAFARQWEQRDAGRSTDSTASSGVLPSASNVAVGGGVASADAAGQSPTPSSLRHAGLMTRTHDGKVPFRDTKSVKPRAPRAVVHGAVVPSKRPSASASPTWRGGNPSGADCTRSSECQSMVCAAEVCQ